MKTISVEEWIPLKESKDLFELEIDVPNVDVMIEGQNKILER